MNIEEREFSDSDSGLAAVKAISVDNGFFSNSFIATKNVAVQQGGSESINVKYLRRIRTEQQDREKRLSARRLQSLQRIREISIGDAGDGETVLKVALQKVVDFVRPIDHVRFFSTLKSASARTRDRRNGNVNNTKGHVSGGEVFAKVLDFFGLSSESESVKQNNRKSGDRINDIDLFVAIVSNRQSGVESAAIMFFKQDKIKPIATKSSKRLPTPNWNPLTLITLVPIVSDTRIRLKGGGMLRIFSAGQYLELDTVSVRSLWGLLTVLQNQRTHARENNLYTPVTNHQWIKVYDNKVETGSTIDSEGGRGDGDRDLTDFDDGAIADDERDLSDESTESDPDYLGDEDEEVSKPKKSDVRKEIRNIILSFDPDNLTMDHVVNGLKVRFGDDVIGENGYSKSFVDKCTLQTFGQLEPPSEIIPGLHLGTEYNASNQRELIQLGVKVIVNVTNEVENFFPNTFDYHKISLVDKPTSNLQEHFDAAVDKIENAMKNKQGVLVHCQRGISRSASIVIVYIMRSKNISYNEAFQLVKDRRSIIKPNKGFIKQMKEYEQQQRGY